jgi:UDP-N-acetylglucosamine--N-acetylmuramyl-(pentapeptide) pyrophosphoryl-undecaprenol N-acetylglucosamine transferase
MNHKKPYVLLSAGGSGGHVFPARALAEELIARGFCIVLATDTRGLKYFDGLDVAIPRHIIASGTYTSGVIGKISGSLELVKGFFQSMKLIRSYRPVAVVGFGGYPSAPPLFAGQVLGVPTVLHEQNAILGLANKWLAPLSKKIALSYVDTVGLSEKIKIKAQFTGNPVRQAIADLAQGAYPACDGKITIMAVGGSQGAKVFSDVVPLALAALPGDVQRRLHIVQQSRPDAVDAVREIYLKTELDFEIKSFFDDMPDRIQAAHLFITRSGASTVAELTAAGRPAIYVPFPFNRDNQQVFNAEQVEKLGGGWMILERNLTVESLKITLESLLTDPEKLTKSANAAKKLGCIDAAQRLADIVVEFR